MKQLDKIIFTYQVSIPISVICGTKKEIKIGVEKNLQKASCTKLKCLKTKCKWRKE